MRKTIADELVDDFSDGLTLVLKTVLKAKQSEYITSTRKLYTFKDGSKILLDRDDPKFHEVVV